MAKIQPLPAAAASPSPCSSSSSDGHHQSPQAYTVWMKSLVFNGNGCAVYGPDGSVAFRVDNYGCRGGREVFLMDRTGNALIRIRRKGFGMFRGGRSAGAPTTAARRSYAATEESDEGCGAVAEEGGEPAPPHREI